jgi:hypothetical protein
MTTLNQSPMWHAALRAGAVVYLLVGTVLAAGGGSRQPVASAANVRINIPQAAMPNGRLGRSADAIAADPTGKLLVAAWESMQGTCGPPFGGECRPPKTPGVTIYGYSTDGGRTWTEAGAPFLGDGVMTSGHAWLDRGGADQQTFFLVSRARTVETTPRDLTPGGSGQLGVVVYRGRFKNGAFTWSDQHLLSPGKPGDLFRSPSVIAAKDGSGKVYVALSRLLAMCGLPGRSSGQIEVFSSADQGKTWNGPVIVSAEDTPNTEDPKDPACGAYGTYQLSSSGAMGPRGELYLVWQFGPWAKFTPPATFDIKPTVDIGFSRSLDGGRTFTPPRRLVTLSSMRENVPVAYSKNTINDYPRIAVALGGRHRGRIYVTYTSALAEASSQATAQSLTSSQVHLIHSDDQGTTWSAPVPLGPPVPPAGVKRFWPTVAVRAGGEVDVVYLESQEKQVTADPADIECDIPLVSRENRKGKVSSLMDVYWVQSRDGGASFGPPVRVTTETSNWCKVSYDMHGTQFANFGNYIGISSAGNRTFAIFPDGRNGVPDVYFAELTATGGAAAGMRK